MAKRRVILIFIISEMYTADEKSEKADGARDNLLLADILSACPVK